ncbi:MAG: type IV toxin-antitoxin system AbiEi family antitoxin domain-containing protein [Propionibacteriaceae bacterium]|jgi:predicted transcriptional regulator of viral defense system|nr:type IV toxin-antitoxin system AbiEi family antitoxin domain-containing protein [Propionibacteriaceae bacterium]
MAEDRLARHVLWEVAQAQHGYVTARQADDLGVSNMALLMLARRGTLERGVRGVYRFPQFPVSQYDPFMLAVLWTGADEACLSHETALDAYGISDVNPNTIHITVPKGRRIRRSGGDDYTVHHEDLAPAQIGWWQEIPTVTPGTAVAQCLAYGTPTYLLRQALERGHRDGRLTTDEHDELARALEERHAR